MIKTTAWLRESALKISLLALKTKKDYFDIKKCLFRLFLIYLIIELTVYHILCLDNVTLQ